MVELIWLRPSPWPPLRIYLPQAQTIRSLVINAGIPQMDAHVFENTIPATPKPLKWDDPPPSRVMLVPPLKCDPKAARRQRALKRLQAQSM